MKQKTIEKDCAGQKERINEKEHNNPPDTARGRISPANKERPQANGEARP
jgi:hypothetical protein